MKYLLSPAIVILISLIVVFAIQSYATQVSHTLGDGFTLCDDTIKTSVIVRNNSPISIPSVELPYSYGARVIEGNAGCDLNLTEGIRPCGSRTVWLGIINRGESKAGALTIHPNHGNFTIKLSAQVWVFSQSFDAAQTHVYCWTNDGEKYSCNAGFETLPGEPVGFSSLYLIIVAVTTLSIIVVSLWMIRIRRPYSVLNP